MPIKQMPKFQATQDKMLEIPQPGIGGLNLFDLEYEQEINQSPYMLNMMYRNGTFSKRYGQEIVSSYTDKVYAIEYFDGKLIVHAGSYIYCDGVEIGSASERPGFFVRFGQSLLYFCDGSIYEYKYEEGMWLWTVQEPYIPDVFTECQPQSGGTYNRMDDFNLLTLQYSCLYNGDGTATKYYPYGDEDSIINWEIAPTVYVDEVKQEYGVQLKTYDKTHKYIEFNTSYIPSEGADNVQIIYTMKEDNLEADRERLLACKYFNCYGSNGTSHLFLGGGGDSKLFYSDSYDASYFPENNWIILGSTEQDITGIGLQYNVLIVFKPQEIYSLYSYQTTASMVTSEEEDLIGTEAFGCTLVNSQIGCDAPYSIQLINNSLTWFNSNEGVCTLVSTNIADERNVRAISRNINHTNNMGVTGILDLKEDLECVCSADYDSKYFLVFPESGLCYMWDYAIVPFSYTSSKITDPRMLDWFLFDKFYVRQFIKVGQDLYYLSNLNRYIDKIIKLNDSLSDLDFNNDGINDGIEAYYQTPYNEFKAIEMLKTITNVYIQCRGDRPTSIDMLYITDEDINGEKESDPVVIPGTLWKSFAWSVFDWKPIPIMNTFRRKCSIKKVQVVGIRFSNNIPNSDMSISHLALQYRPIKYIK